MKKVYTIPLWVGQCGGLHTNTSSELLIIQTEGLSNVYVTVVNNRIACLSLPGCLQGPVVWWGWSTSSAVAAIYL